MRPPRTHISVIRAVIERFRGEVHPGERSDDDVVTVWLGPVGRDNAITTSSKSGDRGSGLELSWWFLVFLNRPRGSNIFILCFGVDALSHWDFRPVNGSIVRIAWGKYSNGSVSSKF